jgi:hypothetical protein
MELAWIKHERELANALTEFMREYHTVRVIPAPSQVAWFAAELVQSEHGGVRARDGQNAWSAKWIASQLGISERLVRAARKAHVAARKYDKQHRCVTKGRIPPFTVKRSVWRAFDMLLRLGGGILDIEWAVRNVPPEQWQRLADLTRLHVRWREPERSMRAIYEHLDWETLADDYRKAW